MTAETFPNIFALTPLDPKFKAALSTLPGEILLGNRQACAQHAQHAQRAAALKIPVDAECVQTAVCVSTGTLP